MMPSNDLSEPECAACYRATALTQINILDVVGINWLQLMDRAGGELDGNRAV